MWKRRDKPQIRFPENRKFAFSIFDDTDGSTIANTEPVYRFLAENGIRTTKSVWVYPPRGPFTGGCLVDPQYRNWILQLKSQGFEIALHNVGDGLFTRQEIIDGIELFRSIIGEYPAAHTNHASNPDNIYWGEDRFEWPLSYLYALAFRLYRGRTKRVPGHDPASPHFWGDVCKQRIRYIRNFTFNGINTLAYDPRMPYLVKLKEKYSNFWFSSSDGQTVVKMNDLLSKANCDKLEACGGVCIIYTHFGRGFVDANGRLDPTFEERMRFLASRPGWFVPVSTLLDHLLSEHPGEDPGHLYRLRLNVWWTADRLAKKLRYGH